MSDGTTLWGTALLCLAAGVVIGIAATLLFRRTGPGPQRTRRRLAETELELDRMREQLDQHFTSVDELVENLQRQSEALRQQIGRDDRQLRGNRHDRARSEPLAGAEAGQDDASPDAPRDYADGARGTLDEAYFSRSRDQRSQQVEQPATPPRY
ncbi:hypothetical protein C7446_2230 [Kushneria sinocarnis]|uniref:Z-ring associated protein G n=1 Tax=Kushneria sinocarnis TaxID=595502 RepID=A0A420WVF8_9GAMM|nr:DUF1043 family protein [Kushneria sinocarnis]RKR02514.1 hypothetical protein C7446_2230 [Kushneria sinocarnis]